MKTYYYKKINSRGLEFCDKGYMYMKQKGFTLLELVTTIVVVAIIVAIGVPSFNNLIERNRLKGAAEEVYAGFQNARLESIKLNRSVTVNFNVDAGDDTVWCFGLKVNGTCDCTQTDVTQADFCEIENDADNNDVSTVVASSDFPTVKMTAIGFAGNRTTITPRRGTALAGSVTLSSQQNEQLQISLSPLGRVRICSPSGSTLGYESC